MGEKVPVGNVAGCAPDLVEEFLANLGVAGLPAAGRAGMVEQVPFGDIEIAFGDFLAIAVAVGIVEADAGQAGLGLGANDTAILAGGADELLGAGVGDQGQAVALGAGVGR